MVGASPAPPPPPPSTSACPKCGQPVPANSRFCNACGASLTPAAPAPATPPVDLRQSVDQSRGMLKRLQLLVPGYSGYRQATDIQAADSLLRLQVADKIRNARATLENARTALTNASQFAVLTDIAPLLADLQRLEGEIRHAEQGYTGISPAVRINPQQLDRLYEYDFGFAQAADQLSQTIAPLPSLSMSGGSGVPALLSTARGQVTQLEQAFKARLQAIEGIRVS
ncbi:MAG: zinc ribbon domain-containing protein [Thermoplasmata archaeon]